jgi:hypothetical protein
MGTSISGMDSFPIIAGMDGKDMQATGGGGAAHRVCSVAHPVHTRAY